MKGISAALIFWLFATFGWSQIATQVPNDLLEFEQSDDVEARCEALIHACFNSSHADPAAGIGYGIRAIAIARADGLLKLEADAHNSLGLCYDTQSKADSAMHHFELAATMLERTGFPCEIAAVYVNIGNAQKRSLKYSASLASFTTALEIQENCGELGNRAMVLQALGSSYNALNNYEKAIEYFDAALEIERKHGLESRLGPIYHSKANSLLGLQRLEEAAELFKLAIDSYHKSGNEYHVAYTFESIAHLHVKLQNFDSAIFYSNKALDIFKVMDAKMDMVYEELFLSDILILTKDYKSALTKLQELLPITIAENLPHDRMDVMKNLSLVYAGLGDYQAAYTFKSKHMLLKDSLNVDEQKAEMSAIVNKFETDKRDKQIALEQAQKAQIQTESNRQKQQKYFLLFGVILLGLLIIVLINRYLQKQRNAQQLTLANVQIAKEKERAERSERMKQDFLSNMSHEIRTPINAINGLSRLLLDKHHDQSTTEFLEAINHSGENLMVILNDILDIAKVEAGKLDIFYKPFNLATEMKSLANIYQTKATNKGLELAVYSDAAIPDLLLGDATRIAQILGNLVSNAIKFTAHGKVELHVLHSEDGLIHFNVNDTGIGISKLDQARIFEGFEQIVDNDTPSQGGTGLGLAIAKNLVALMGGELQVESELGTGSNFHFALPLETAPGFVTGKDVYPEAIDRTFHVIVAEDNEYNFWVTRGSLAKYFPNSKIYRARNGKEVISLLNEDDYDIIIMDVQMPELNGLEATELLRKENVAIPILGLTASVLLEDQEKCLSAGMNALVQKPFKDEVFVSTMSSLLKLVSEPKVAENQKIDEKQISQFLKWMPGHLQKLEGALKLKDLAIVKDVSHQMRPQIEANKIEDVGLALLAFEQLDHWDKRVAEELETVISAIRSKLNEYQMNTT